jgi:hypothetical protein
VKCIERFGDSISAVRIGQLIWFRRHFWNYPFRPA